MQLFRVLASNCPFLPLTSFGLVNSRLLLVLFFTYMSGN